MRTNRLSYANVVSTLALIVVVIGVPPVGAHVKDNFGHLWTEHLKPKISDPGTINDGDNPVDYSKLKNVPAGFADGADYGIEETGFGLKVVRPFLGKRYFTVDSEKVQKRVGGKCDVGLAITSIDQDGNVSCGMAPGPSESSSAKTYFSSSGGHMCNTQKCVVGTLTVPNGHWVVLAELAIGCTEHCEEQGATVECDLRAGDETISYVARWANAGDNEALSNLSFHGVGSFSGNVSLRCIDDGDSSSNADFLWSHVRLTAIGVGSLSQ